MIIFCTSSFVSTFVNIWYLIFDRAVWTVLLTTDKFSGNKCRKNVQYEAYLSVGLILYIFSAFVSSYSQNVHDRGFSESKVTIIRSHMSAASGVSFRNYPIPNILSIPTIFIISCGHWNTGNGVGVFEKKLIQFSEKIKYSQN